MLSPNSTKVPLPSQGSVNGESAVRSSFGSQLSQLNNEASVFQSGVGKRDLGSTPTGTGNDEVKIDERTGAVVQPPNGGRAGSKSSRPLGAWDGLPPGFVYDNWDRDDPAVAAGIIPDDGWRTVSDRSSRRHRAKKARRARRYSASDVPGRNSPVKQVSKSDASTPVQPHPPKLTRSASTPASVLPKAGPGYVAAIVEPELRRPPPLSVSSASSTVSTDSDSSADEMDATLIKSPNPKPSVIDNYDGRDLVPEFEKFDFPLLCFAGIWNNSFTASSMNHASHWGVHVKCNEFLEVELPKGFVGELEVYLVNKFHDNKFASYQLCQVKAINLSKRLLLTSDQLFTCLLYAPALAYYRRWGAVQNVSRVVTQSHINWSWWKAILATVAVGCPAYHAWTGGLFPTVKEGPQGYVKKAITTAAIGGAVYRAITGAFLKPTEESPPGYTASGGLRDGSGRYATETAKPASYLQRVGSKVSEGFKAVFVKDKVRAPDEVRHRIEQVGPTDVAYRPRCFENNAANQLESVRARVVRATPDSDPLSLSGYVAFVKQNAQKLLGPAVKVNRLTFDQWLSGSNASPSVKASLKRAHDLLIKDGIDANDGTSAIPPLLAKAWTTRKAFCKEEFLTQRTPDGVVDKAPRLIQGAKPEFIVLVGPYITALQGLIKSRWNVNNWACFVSGVSPSQVAKSVVREGIQVFENDMGKYDACFDRELLLLEVWIAQRFGASRSVIDLMTANVDTHGVTSSGIKYKRSGGRCSGDPYTSLFNSVQNALMHMYIYCTVTGYSVDLAMFKLRMAVCGDDNIGSHDGYQIDWKSEFERLGFEAVPKYRVEPTGAEFCSMRLVKTSIGWTFVPKIGRVLNKIAWCLDRPKTVTIPQLIRGTVLSLYSQSKCLPPLRAWMDRILLLTHGEAAYRPKDEPWKMTPSDNGDCTVDTWAYLAEYYHWDGAKQQVWEAYLTSIDYVAKPIKHPYLSLLIEADTDGPSDLFCTQTKHRDADVTDVEFRPQPAESLSLSASWVEVVSQNSQRLELSPEDFLSDRDLGDRCASVQAGNTRTIAQPAVLMVGGAGGSKNKKKSKPKPRRPKSKQTGQTNVRQAQSVSSGSFGRRAGSAVGGFLGDLAQKAFTTITGMGDYTVQQNSLYAGSVKSNQPPSFISNASMGIVRLRHREYVTDVSTIGSAFNMTSYVINPTNPTLFPWLSSIAANFEQWKLHGLVFFFNTNSATAVSSTNTALGTVIMATQYNVNETLFTGKLQMEQYQYCVSTVPSVSAMHPVECKPSLGTLEVLYTVADNGTEDARFTDFGRFNIATVGQQAACNIGELWVCYDVEFIKPRLFTDSMNVAPPFNGFSAYLSGVSNGIAMPWSLTDMFQGSPATTFGQNNAPGFYIVPSSTLNVTLGTLANGNSNTLVFSPDLVGTYFIWINYQLFQAGYSVPITWTNSTSWSSSKSSTVTEVANMMSTNAGFTGENQNPPYYETLVTSNGQLRCQYYMIVQFKGDGHTPQTINISPANWQVSGGGSGPGTINVMYGQIMITPVNFNQQ